MRTVRALSCIAALPLAAWSCAGGAGAADAPSPDSCAVAAATLAPGARADALAGDYRLTLVATNGTRAGQAAGGTLSLRAFGATPPPIAAEPGVRYPLYGASSVPLADVGAIALGDVARGDAAAPGVLAIEWQRDGNNQITLRFGADANRAGPRRFDGTRMALFVTSTTAGGFAGNWESGGGDVKSGGHFCAERVAQR